MDRRGAPRAQAGRHVLAGDRRRVRGRAESRRRAQDRLSHAELGRVVLHVRRELHAEVHPLARPPVSLREGREQLHVQRRGPAGPRAVGPSARLRRQAGEPAPAACPDDTWVLRPQDLPEGFQPTDDTWYYARVAGTFKERQGFHGCQMPEQLLGRIIRVSSNPGDVVLDPFAGSGTTLAVAKKLGRSWLGCELSEEYTRAATRALECDRRRHRARRPRRPDRQCAQHGRMAASSETNRPTISAETCDRSRLRRRAVPRLPRLAKLAARNGPRRNRRFVLRGPRRPFDRLAVGESAVARRRFTKPAAKRASSAVPPIGIANCCVSARRASFPSAGRSRRCTWPTTNWTLQLRRRNRLAAGERQVPRSHRSTRFSAIP